MNVRTHFSFGVFLSVIVYGISKSLLFGYLTLVVQVGLVLDYFLHKLIGKEPFHSLTLMVIVSGASAWYSPEIGLVVFISYASHLLLDLFADEKLEWFFPFSKKSFSLYRRDQEKTVENISIWGTLLLLGYFLLS